MKPKTYETMQLRREGREIILAEGMTYQHGRDWLTKIEQAEEAVIDIHQRFECFPLDGLCAFSDAVVAMFGWVEMPKTQIQVPDSPTTTRATCYGQIKPPSLDGGIIQVSRLDLDNMSLMARVKRKFETQVRDIFEAVRKQLLEHSIYRGKAIRVKFPEDGDWSANVENTAPVFMDLNGISADDLILNGPVQFALESNVFTLVENTELCRKARIPLRHGMLLAGPYGTGKTLTAKVIAAKCVANGWTFVYLEQVKDIAHGLRIAEMFSPAVLFAEDIDSVTANTNRDAHMNDILNVLDGIDTKSKPVISVLTTNRLETIHRAFLRAGRIDTVVEYELPDALTAQRFVKLYCRDAKGHSLLAADADMAAIGEAFAGLLPAFIAEAIQKAKRYSLRQPCVSQETLLRAAAAIHRHAKLVEEPPTLTIEKQLVSAAALLGDALHETGHFETRD